jgi:hypothetical protein
LFVRFEIASDEDQAGLRPESGVVDCAQEFSVEADAGRQVAVAQDLPLLIEGLPEAVRAHVEQGQLQIGFLRPAVGDDGPEAGEAEGKLAGDRQELSGEGAFFGEFEKTEQEQGLVRRGAPGAVDFQVGEFMEEAWHGALIQRRMGLQLTVLTTESSGCFLPQPPDPRTLSTAGITLGMLQYKT